MHRPPLNCAVVFTLLLIAAGCGGGVRTETVAGKITLDGAPLPKAAISIIPVNRNNSAKSDPNVDGPFSGLTNEQGEYSIGSIDRPGKGAPAGNYKLSIRMAPPEGANELTVIPPEKVPAPYSTIGVDFEVPPGGKTDANFDLVSKKKK
jgi:hypothetical protein